MEILYWHWWILGLALLVAEMLLPTGFFLIWIGAAAILVGAVAWLVPALSWEVEMVMFGVLSVASFLTWRRFRPVNLPSDQPTLNRRGQSYVGRSFTLATPIVNGVGKLHVDDSQWRISGADAEAGTQVKVVAVDGSTLKVERA
jgi:membrane protein implicated in regulation of membrane protease activity